MKEVLRRYGPGLTAAIVALCAFWVVMLIVLPQLLMIDFSLRPSLPPARSLRTRRPRKGR